MSTYDAVLGAADSVRRAALRAGGLILLAMGGASMAVAIGGLIFAGGGVMFLPLALPPLAAGSMVVRKAAGARIFGFLVAALYGGFLAYAATYSMRGLTPPPGQSDPRQIDLGSALIACAFLAAAVLILIGRGRHEAAGRRPARA
jgi:hypothetical protein